MMAMCLKILLDNNLNTRWSNLGFPSYIQYDLGQSQPICNVDIAWYRGNLRENTFTISVSNDGINFTPIFSGQRAVRRQDWNHIMFQTPWADI